MNKKICHISTVHRLYDTRIFYKECSTLRKNGYTVFLVIKHVRDETIDGINIRSLPAVKNRARRILILSFLAFFKALGTGAVIYHFHDPELIPVGLLLKILRKKVIYDIHEDLPDQILSKKWVGPLFVRKVLSCIVLFIEKISSLFFDCMMCTTPYIQERFNNRKTILVRNFPVLRLIDDADTFKSGDDSYKIIYTGGLTKNRGIKDIIKAMEYIKHDVRLLLIGKWESRYFKEECEQMYGWRFVTYLGLKKPVDVYRYMKSAHIGIQVVHSLQNYMRGLPVKCFEFMACSLPMIISDQPVKRQLFHDCALFVRPGSPEDIADKIVELITNNDLRRKLGSNGRKLVITRYSWELERKKLIDGYKKLINA